MITQKLLAHIDTLKPKIDEWAVEAVLENRGVIVNLVKFGQLAKGLNSFGNPLAWNKGTGFYAKSTQSFANRDNIGVPKTKGAPYNFQWSGEFFDNMKLEDVNKSENTYEITTIQGKQKLLESVYGDIIDLTPENNDFVNKTIIEPYLAQKIEENILLF